MKYTCTFNDSKKKVVVQKPSCYQVVQSDKNLIHPIHIHAFTSLTIFFVGSIMAVFVKVTTPDFGDALSTCTLPLRTVFTFLV